MKIALCTTTIHVPHALKLLRKCSPDVRFFVAGDVKSPSSQIMASLSDDRNHLYVGYGAHHRWKCHYLLGENTLSRRNIAFLEALKWGADIVISWDTDNIPVSREYFTHFERILTQPFSGMLGSSKAGWFDAGQMLVPWARHRGIPYNNISTHHYDIADNFRAGIAAGLCIGNPDIDATTRMERRPEVHNVSKLATMGVLVDVNTHTVFNSQNTAVIRDLVPSWFMMPGVGRHDDLYASLIVQRVARERGLHVHFGEPLAWQERHPHDELIDLTAELAGMKHIRAMADLLDSIPLIGNNTIDDTRKIYQTLLLCEFLPRASVEAGLVWLEDCEGVL